MAQHISLVYGYRGAKTKEEVSTQAVLCRKGFEFYRKAARLGLGAETWSVVLKLVLGVTEALLRPGAGDDGQLGRELAAEALHMLYEVWLASRTREESLWSSFVEYHRGWTHLPEAVAQWASAVGGLATALVDGLYFQQGQGAVVRIATTAPQEATLLELNAKDVGYAWHRVYQLLGGVSTMPTAGTFSQAMKGLAAVVQIFLSVVRAGCADAPDGNTLLGIFGGDLFETALLNRPEREEGTATAISTLCAIFTGCARSCFAPRYLAGLYSAVRTCLGSPYHSPVLIATLKSTEALFTADFAGARVLVPYYVRAIEGIMTAHLDKQGMDAAAIERYRVTCLGIVARLLGLRNRFQGARFPVEVPGVDPSLPPMATYYDLEPHIGFILYKALLTEASPQTVCRVLWLSLAFVVEHLPAVADPGPVSVISPQVGLQVAPRFAWTLQTLILKQAMVQFWALDAVVASLDVLTSLALVYEHLPSKEEYASRVVLRLCDLVLDRMAAIAAAATNSNVSTNAETIAAATRIVSTAFAAITTWVMTGRWLAAASACMGRILETCFACMHAPALGLNNNNNSSSSNSNSGSGNDTQEAALQCFLSIANRWGAYPNTNGPERMSSLVNEEFLLSKTAGLCKIAPRDVVSCIHYYAMGDSAIITFIDVPALTQRTDSIATIVVVRDRTGKYVWLSQLQTLPEAQERAAKAAPAVTATPQCTVPHRSEALQRSLAEREGAVQGLCEDLDKMGLGALRGAVQMAASSKASYLQGNKYFLGGDVAVQPPAHTNVGAFLGREQCKYLGGRMLAGQLGLTSAYGRPALVPIEYSGAFQSALKQLDMQPERTCMSVGVVFQGTGQETEEEVYANQSANPAFFAFVRSLGWPVKVAKHAGFLGGLDRKGSTGESAVYYADHAAELIYHVAPLMPSDGAANLHKKRLISKDYVLVVWSEDGLYDDTALESPHNDLKIVISPLASGLYNVRVIRSDRLASATAAATLPGPLQGTTVVGRCALGPLVRLTAMNAYRAIVASLIGPARPFALRQRILADIIRHYRSDPTFGALFTPLFFHRYTDAKISFSAATPLVAASAQIAAQAQTQTQQQQQPQRQQQPPQRSPPPPPPPSAQRYQQQQQQQQQQQSQSSPHQYRRDPPPLPPLPPSHPHPPSPLSGSGNSSSGGGGSSGMGVPNLGAPPVIVPTRQPPPTPSQPSPLRKQSSAQMYQHQPLPSPPSSSSYQQQQQQQQQQQHKHQVSAQPSLPSPSRPAPKVPPPALPPPTRITPIAGQRPAPPPPPQSSSSMARGPGTLQPAGVGAGGVPQHTGFIPGHRPAPPPPGTQRWVPFDRRKKQ